MNKHQVVQIRQKPIGETSFVGTIELTSGIIERKGSSDLHITLKKSVILARSASKNASEFKVHVVSCGTE